MAACHPLTLAFADRALESSYLESSLERERIQGRAAIIVGSLVYVLYGVLDRWLVPDDAKTAIWTLRLSMLVVPMFVYWASYTPMFNAHRHVLLASVGLAAGVGIIAMLTFLSVESAAYFYPGLVLVTFYTYNFVGTRFIHALCIDFALLLAYNIVFGGVHAYPFEVLASHDFFILSANLIGGTAGYLNEKQKRLLFLRERELNEERHKQLTRALHDSLTGLPNRELLHDRLEQALMRAQRDEVTYCGYFIDLDGFKSVNDRLGHQIGDQLLHQVAQQLKRTVRQSDTIARLGGDEFFYLAEGIRTEADATALAHKIIQSIETAMGDVAADLPLGASIGMCLFPYPGLTEVSDIIRQADHAMYRAKLGGKGVPVLATGDLELQTST